MRSYHYLIIGLVLILCFEAATAARYPLNARQDDSPSSERSQAPATTDADRPRTQSSDEPSGEPTPTRTQSERASQTPSDADTSPTPSETPSVTMQAPSTAIEETQPSSTDGPTSQNPLPIHPKVTPAIGLAGAILLISGAVYAVIGIKNKWLYIFFSAAYLTSLAVTVLIVYLMTPPVSDAVQGGFFVAALLTGVIFGALSLVFSDITDGLGCLLGGFCLGMWFLTLKEGGLIGPTTGRAIFIGCMSVAGFSLSFSHYTRTYGLIVCISFAGATITILGIDCVSRAGLKEFWLYLWDLNDNIFPLNTSTYPITRGIKVEVACIVLLTVFGIISQLKLWKTVKERREKSAAARLEREKNLEREEEELGRKMEDNFTRERAQWEATYGDKALQQDSVVEPSDRSSRKTSISVREREVSSFESVEMANLAPKQDGDGKADFSRPTSNHVAAAPTVTVTVLHEEDDEIQQIDSAGKPIPPPKADAPGNVNRSLSVNNNNSRPSSVIAPSGNREVPRSASTRSSLQAPVPPPPAIVPLPFTIPKEEDARSDTADNASVSAVPESVHESMSIRRSLSKRLSGGSVFKRLSGNRLSSQEMDEEALIVPHIEDDRSSVAATLDDDRLSLPDVSPPRSPMVLGFSDKVVGESTSESGSKRTSVAEGDARPNVEQPATTPETDVDVAEDATAEPKDAGEKPQPKVEKSLTSSTDPKPEAPRIKRTSSSTPRQRSDTVVSAPDDEGLESTQQSKSNKSGAPSMTSHTGSQVALSKGVLPERLSKVALSYRTNEWAKHLEVAEKPELDDIPEPESPGVKVSHGADEQPVPVSDEIQGIEPVVVAKRNSKRTSTGTNAYRNENLMRSASAMSRNSLVTPLHSVAQPPALAAGGVSRTTSKNQNRGLRSSSTPYLTQNQMADLTGTRMSSTPSPLPNNTLMGQRETLVRSRPVPQSFQNASSPNLLSEDPENLTLAQRKQMMQHQKPPSASQQWRQSNWAIGGQMQGFDSHQPRRFSGGNDPTRREVMLANWRESMRQEAPQVNNTVNEEGRRIALINERRQKELEKQQQDMAAQQRESVMGNMMRSSQMLDAHREAMRRMQAKANRNAS